MLLIPQPPPSANVADEIAEVYRLLSSERDLSPNNQLVNRLLGGLVRLVTKQHDAFDSAGALESLSESGLLEGIRDICQRAECLLESHYSSLIASY